MKICTKCKKEKLFGEFFKDKNKKDGYRSQCKDCHKAYYLRPDIKKKYWERRKIYNNLPEVKEKRLVYKKKWRKEFYGIKENRQQFNALNNKSKFRRKYGITLVQKEQMWIDQSKQCANNGCRRELETLQKAFVDHDHKTGKIRGLLCDHCNYVLGHAYDSPVILNGLIDYLNRYV